MVRSSPPRNSSRFVPSRKTPRASPTRPLWTSPDRKVVVTTQIPVETIQKENRNAILGQIETERESIRRMRAAAVKASDRNDDEKADALYIKIESADARIKILQKYSSGEYTASSVLRYSADVGREMTEQNLGGDPWSTRLVKSEPGEKSEIQIIEGWKQIGPDKYRQVTPRYTDMSSNLTSTRVVTGREAALKAGAIDYTWTQIGKDKYRQQIPKKGGGFVTRVWEDVPNLNIKKENLTSSMFSDDNTKTTNLELGGLFKGNFYKYDKLKTEKDTKQDRVPLTLSGRGPGLDTSFVTTQQPSKEVRQTLSWSGFLTPKKRAAQWVITKALGRKTVGEELADRKAEYVKAKEWQIKGAGGYAVPKEKRIVLKGGMAKLQAKKYITHELLHVRYPDWSEKKVRRMTPVYKAIGFPKTGTWSKKKKPIEFGFPKGGKW